MGGDDARKIFGASPMCFSEKVSWITFAVSIAGVLNAFEALLWRDPSDLVVARTAAIVNHAQPLIFWALSASALQPKSPGAALRAEVALAAYVAAVSPYTVRAMHQPQLVVVGPRGLEWTWHYGEHREIVYGLFLASMIATADAYFDWRISAVILGTFLASWAQYRETNMIGSMWCFYAAFLPWLLVLYT